jgi:hypothetical protein
MRALCGASAGFSSEMTHEALAVPKSMKVFRPFPRPLSSLLIRTIWREHSAAVRPLRRVDLRIESVQHTAIHSSNFDTGRIS